MEDYTNPIMLIQLIYEKIQKIQQKQSQRWGKHPFFLRNLTSVFLHITWLSLEFIHPLPLKSWWQDNERNNLSHVTIGVPM